jgi:hypothetical protein
MALQRLLIFLFTILPLYSGAASSADTSELYFIDAHSQVDHQVVPLKKVLSVMEINDVSHTILSTRGKLKDKDLLIFFSKHRYKITPAVRTKGKPYDAGSPKYYKKLEAQVAKCIF